MQKSGFDPQPGACVRLAPPADPPPPPTVIYCVKIFCARVRGAQLPSKRVWLAAVPVLKNFSRALRARTAPSAPPGPRGPKSPLGEGARLYTTKATPNGVDIAGRNRYKLIQQ